MYSLPSLNSEEYFYNLKLAELTMRICLQALFYIVSDFRFFSYAQYKNMIFKEKE